MTLSSRGCFKRQKAAALGASAPCRTPRWWYRAAPRVRLMLYSSTFSNFASFSSDAIFDLAAPKNRVRNRYPGNFVQLESGERVLKDAVLVGENAGGKSNFVKAFKFLRSLFARNDVAPRSYDNLVFSLGSADNDGEQISLRCSHSRSSSRLATTFCGTRYAWMRRALFWRSLRGSTGRTAKAIWYLRCSGGMTNDAFAASARMRINAKKAPPMDIASRIAWRMIRPSA